VNITIHVLLLADFIPLEIKEKQERMSRIKKAALIGGSIAIGCLIIRNRKPIFDAMKVGVGWLLG